MNAIGRAFVVVSLTVYGAAFGLRIAGIDPPALKAPAVPGETDPVIRLDPIPVPADATPGPTERPSLDILETLAKLPGDAVPRDHDPLTRKQLKEWLEATLKGRRLTVQVGIPRVTVNENRNLRDKFAWSVTLEAEPLPFDAWTKALADRTFGEVKNPRSWQLEVAPMTLRLNDEYAVRSLQRLAERVEVPSWQTEKQRAPWKQHTIEGQCVRAACTIDYSTGKVRVELEDLVINGRSFAK